MSGRVILIGLSLASGLIAATPASAQNATASVSVLKPLQLTAQRNLAFGNITIATFTGSQSVSVTPSGRTCGSGAGLTCSGTANTAQYKVTGSNRQVVLISSATPSVTMSNGAGSSFSLTPSFPASVTMPNSGNQGVLFEVGGTISLNSNLAEGIYSGTIDIQVAYQ